MKNETLHWAMDILFCYDTAAAQIYTQLRLYAFEIFFDT